MNKYAAAAAILLASTGIAAAQTVIPCTSTDPSADVNGECSSAPTTALPDTADRLDQGLSGIDQNPTSAIPEPSTPQGMPPIEVPNDPLGHGIDQNPLGSSSVNQPSGINGNGAISSPAIR